MKEIARIELSKTDRTVHIIQRESDSTPFVVCWNAYPEEQKHKREFALR